MRILEVIDVDPLKFGSFERYCVTNAEYLASKGHEHLLVFKGPPCPELSQALSETKSQVAVRWFRRLGLVDSLRLMAYALQKRVDVVHLHFYDPYSIFTFLSWLLPFRTFVTYHISADATDRPRWQRCLKALRNRLLGMGVRKIFCVSEFSRDRFIHNYSERPQKVVVIHNGVSLDAFTAIDRASKRLHKGVLRVICVAALIEEKGVQDLMRAIEMLRRENVLVSLTVVGDGPYRDALQRLASELDLTSAVTFTGVRSDVPILLQQHDLAVIPSRWDEAFGITVIEAMAAGLPVIGTNTGAIAELVQTGVTGVLVQKEDPRGIADAMRSLYADEDLMDRYGSRGRERAEEHFGVGRTCARQLSHFLEDAWR